MNARILQMIVGLVVFFCSAAAGMAQTAVQEEVRADFFAANDVADDENHVILSFDSVAMLPSLAEIELSETSVESEEEAKRSQKRQSSHQKFLAKCRLHGAFSAKSATKGVASRPQTQDALQQRTATIRYLQDSALI